MDTKSVDVYSTVLPFELHGAAAIVNLHKICVCTTSNIRFFIGYSLQHTHYHIIYCVLLVLTCQLLAVASYIYYRTVQYLLAHLWPFIKTTTMTGMQCVLPRHTGR